MVRKHPGRTKNKQDLEQFLDKTQLDPDLLQKTIKIHSGLGYKSYKSFIYVYMDLCDSKKIKTESKYIKKLNNLKNNNKTKTHNLSKADRKAWWRSLTAEEQTNWRCKKLESLGKTVNWDKEYSKVLEEGNYLR